MATFEMRHGDNTVAIEVQLTRRDGTLQTLSGTETVSFVMTDASGTDVFTGAGVISDQPNSKVKYTFATADTNTRAGYLYTGKMRISFTGGPIETYPTWPQDLLVAIY